MKYAVIANAATRKTTDPQWVAGFARHAEACGFESVVVVEHAVAVSRYSSVYPYDTSGRMELAEDCPIPDPLDLLAFLAGQTTRIGLATGALIIPNHHPVVLAKRLATVDRLSGGRLRACIGVGWMKEEIEACGTTFSTRGRRTDEQIDVLRALWAESGDEGADHDGEFFRFSGAMSYPKPARAAGVPLHIGGHSDAAARRAGRRGDGLQPLGVAGDDLQRLIALMHDEARAHGRDPDALELSLGHMATKVTTERAEALAAKGAHRLVLQVTPSPDLDLVKDELSACAERLGL